MIFQVYVAAAALKLKDHQTVLVVSPLGSIIDDQIEEAKGMGMSATSLSDITDDELRSATFQLLFGPAEKAINNRFVNILKDGTALHRNVAAVVVDERHTVEVDAQLKDQSLDQNLTCGSFVTTHIDMPCFS